MKQWVAWEKTREEQKDFSLNLDSRIDQQRKDLAFNDNLKKQIEALAKNDYKSTDILLDAAKDQAADAKADKKAALPPSGDEANPDGADSNGSLIYLNTQLHDIQLRESLRIMGDWLALLPGQNAAADAAKVATSAANPTAGTATSSSPAVSLPVSPADATR
jgi:hypothetical protein